MVGGFASTSISVNVTTRVAVRLRPAKQQQPLPVGR